MGTCSCEANSGPVAGVSLESTCDYTVVVSGVNVTLDTISMATSVMVSGDSSNSQPQFLSY